MSTLLPAALAIICTFSQPLCAESQRVPISSDPAGDHLGTNSYYNNEARTVHLDSHFSDVNEQAALLVHELTNAEYADAHGPSGGSVAYCEAQDRLGYQAQAAFWRWRWNGRPELARYHVNQDAVSVDWAEYEAIISPQWLPTVVAIGCSPANGWWNP